MATTYGSFPGVQVTVSGGGITSVGIGEEEHLLVFGQAEYQNEGSFPGDGDEDSLFTDSTGSTETAETINARREADNRFGEGSRLADGMREALANGANIDFLYGVAPKRFNVVDETKSTQSGTLDNVPIYEEDVEDEGNIQNIEVQDNGDVSLDVEYDYTSAPSAPSDDGTIAINPLTGEYATSASTDLTFDYKYLDWNSAFTSSDVKSTIAEDEVGIYCALTDSDIVSSDLESEAGEQREVYKMVNAVSGAEPNENQVVTSDGASLESDHSNYTRRDARYDTDNYSSANQSVDADYYFKFAPVRSENSKTTVLGGVGGLFAGNSISDPIYNDELEGYDAIEQSFSKTDADNMRDENVIPVRQAGSIRVKDNLSTSTEEDWERDFWRRRIADSVILIGKTIGDSIIGRINDEQTRNSAERLIRQEMRELVGDNLLRPNTGDGSNWYVDVYPDSSNDNQVNIDIGFTPFGIVKRVEETITINT